MTRDQVFPKAVQLAAQHSERETGVLACVSLSQWALESAYGRVMSGQNNPFGIKGTAKNGTCCPTEEVVNGERIKTKAYFRNFPSMDAAFAFHGKLLSNAKGPYKASIPLMNDWRAYLPVMGKVYATDPHYATKLVEIIKRWHLEELNLPKED